MSGVPLSAAEADFLLHHFRGAVASTRAGDALGAQRALAYVRAEGGPTIEAAARRLLEQPDSPNQS